MPHCYAQRFKLASKSIGKIQPTVEHQNKYHILLKKLGPTPQFWYVNKKISKIPHKDGTASKQGSGARRQLE
jgi:hypothetical protein